MKIPKFLEISSISNIASYMNCKRIPKEPRRLKKKAIIPKQYAIPYIKRKISWNEMKWKYRKTVDHVIKLWTVPISET